VAVATLCSNYYCRYLRNKVDRGFDRQLIQTVRGVGYRLRE